MKGYRVVIDAWNKEHPHSDEESDPPKGRKKRKKDPDAPKKPTSAYFSFQKEVWPELKAKNPSCGVGDIAKLISERWKNLNDQQKDPLP